MFKMQFYFFERFHSSSLQQNLSTAQEQIFLLAWKAILPTANTSSLWNKQSSQRDLQALEQVEPGAG